MRNPVTRILLRGGEATQQGTGHEEEVLKSMVEGQECNRGTMRTRMRSRCPDSQESSSSACVWRGVVWDGVGSGVVSEGHRPRGRTSAKALPGAHSSREGTGPVSPLAFSCPTLTPISMCVRVRGRRSGGEKRTREKDERKGRERRTREKDKTRNAGPKACLSVVLRTHAQQGWARGVFRQDQVVPSGPSTGTSKARKRACQSFAKVWNGLLMHHVCTGFLIQWSMVIQWFPHASTVDPTWHGRPRRQARPFALLDPSTPHLLSASFYGNSRVCLRHTRRAPDPLPSAHQLLLKTLKNNSTEAPERADVSEQESGRKT